MTLNEFIGYAVGSGVLGLLGLASFRVLAKFYPTTMQGVADYAEALERAVRIAEGSGFKGLGKLTYACDLVQGALAAEGIRGKPDSVTRERIRRDVEQVVGRLFPPKK